MLPVLPPATRSKSACRSGRPWVSSKQIEPSSTAAALPRRGPAATISGKRASRAAVSPASVIDPSTCAASRQREPSQSTLKIQSSPSKGMAHGVLTSNSVRPGMATGGMASGNRGWASIRGRLRLAAGARAVTARSGGLASSFPVPRRATSRRRDLLALAGTRVPLALLRSLHGGLERRHEVGDLRGLLGGGAVQWLITDLGLDDRHQRLAVVVLVALWVEAGAEVLDEHHRHVELALVDLRLCLRLGKREPPGVTDLIRPVQGVEEQSLLVERQPAEMLAVTERDLADGHLSGLLQCCFEQVVGLHPHGLGFEVIGALDVQPGLDLVVLDELEDLAGVGAGLRQGVEDVVVVGAPSLVADRGVTVGAEHAKGDALGLGRQVQADGDGDHPEADRAAPHGSGHAPILGPPPAS